MQYPLETTGTNQMWNEQEIKELILYAKQLQSDNEDLRAGIIAIQAKLDNEEKKVATLKFQVAAMQLQLINTNV
jgi:hypothetical protein